MRNLNVTISEEASTKIDKIAAEKGLKNRPDAIDWIITAAFDLVFTKGSNNQ
jgi:metal-responsive CopG/Arc/MetJ family transcriptional regulator